jgi:hypothetical protein
MARRQAPRITCPRCGKEGALERYTSQGKVYLRVRHVEGGKRRLCYLGPEKPLRRRGVTAPPAASSEEAEKLREENERLKAEVARLEEENARLREENARLREVVARVYEARIVQAGSYERMCVRRVAWRESKLPPEVRETGWSILKALAGDNSVDWVAVRMDAFEQLRGFLA